MEDKISIVVPIYKVEKYLDRCVDSLVNQTWSNLEIILVDDGSPDRCGEICDKRAAEDSRIRVIHKPNGGLSDARNAGLDFATGEFVGFLDSDDFIHPEMIRDLYRLILKHNADIAQCSIRSVYDDEILDPGDPGPEKVLTNIEALESMFTPWVVDYVLANNKLYRRSLFKEIRYPLGKIHEDEFTSYKLFFLASRIVVTEKRYFHYFQSPNSIIRSGFNEKKLHYAEAMEDRINFFREKGLDRLCSLAVRRYARWLLLFMYRNRKDLKAHPALLENLKQRYHATEKMVRTDPAASKRLKFVFRNGLAMSRFTGFLIYQNLFRKNIFSRLADWLGLNF